MGGHNRRHMSTLSRNVLKAEKNDSLSQPRVRAMPTGPYAHAPGARSVAAAPVRLTGDVMRLEPGPYNTMKAPYPAAFLATPVQLSPPYHSHVQLPKPSQLQKQITHPPRG